MAIPRKVKGEPKKFLTPRQQELYTLVLCGNSNPQICEKMDLGLGTVRAMLQIIYRYFGYKNKEDLLVRHIDQALVQKQITIMLNQEDDDENF
jgi:DNA-binding NarL/FixJ family response regulator